MGTKLEYNTVSANKENGTRRTDVNWYLKIAMPPGDIVTQNPNPIESHEILAETLPALQQKITRMVNRANKLGLKPIEMQVSKPYPKEMAGPRGQKFTQDFVTVTIRGEAPVLGGWELLARIEHYPDPNNPNAWANVPSIVPGKEGEFPPIYYTTPPTLCEAPWCGREISNRKDTFVVRNVETGETKQIGRTCISTFLGNENLSPNALASYYASFKELSEYLDTLGHAPPEPRGEYGVPTEEVLAWTKAYERRFGFKKGEIGEAARKQFFSRSYWDAGTEDGSTPVRAAEEDYQFAEEAKQYILSKEGEPGLQDFMMQLINIAKRPYLTWQDIGRAVWIVGVYLREKKNNVQQPQAQAPAVSNHLGQVGQKVLMRAKYEKTREWQGDFGTVYYHQFTESHGNKVTWRTGSWPDILDENNPPELYLQGTIKKLDDFKGALSTLVVGTIVPEGNLRAWKKKVDIDMTEENGGTPPAKAGAQAPSAPQTPAGPQAPSAPPAGGGGGGRFVYNW